jgi:hypothetical protein
MLKKYMDAAKARILMVSLGAVMMIAGGLRGEAQVVLRKAVSICLECIGIG